MVIYNADIWKIDNIWETKQKSKCDWLPRWLPVLDFLKYISIPFFSKQFLNMWMLYTKVDKNQQIEKLKKSHPIQSFACFSQWHCIKFRLISL